MCEFEDHLNMLNFSIVIKKKTKAASSIQQFVHPINSVKFFLALIGWTDCWIEDAPL